MFLPCMNMHWPRARQAAVQMVRRGGCRRGAGLRCLVWRGDRHCAIPKQQTCVRPRWKFDRSCARRHRRIQQPNLAVRKRRLHHRWPGGNDDHRIRPADGFCMVDLWKPLPRLQEGGDKQRDKPQAHPAQPQPACLRVSGLRVFRHPSRVMSCLVACCHHQYRAAMWQSPAGRKQPGARSLRFSFARNTPAGGQYPPVCASRPGGPVRKPCPTPYPGDTSWMRAFSVFPAGMSSRIRR